MGMIGIMSNSSSKKLSDKKLNIGKTEKPKLEIKNGTKQQYAYNYLKEKIIKNIYKPQQFLSEVELSKEMGGISRTPIRQALHCLMYEGLVESLPGKGMFVSDLRFEDVIEILEVRACLHSGAVRLFIQRTDDSGIERLGEVLNRQAEAFKSGDYIKAVEIDNEFHLEAVRGARNKNLYSLCQKYVDLMARASYYTTHDANRVKRSLEEHTAIYEAIKERNADKAVELERSHFEGIMKYLAYAQINKHSLFSHTDI
jgi:DNA-binding GntR family transcriptional regulator